MGACWRRREPNESASGRGSARSSYRLAFWGSVVGSHLVVIGAEWPRTDATLITKDILNGEPDWFSNTRPGGKFTGSDVRLGTEKSVRAALKSYEPGTRQRISYNPEDPGEVETILSYSWELFAGPISSEIFGVLFIFGGISVYRWSYGTPVESPKLKHSQSLFRVVPVRIRSCSHSRD